MRRGAGHGLQLHVRVLGSTVHVAAAGRRRHRRHAAKLPAALPRPMDWRGRHGCGDILHRMGATVERTQSKGEVETQRQEPLVRKADLIPLDAKRQPVSYAIVLLLADGTARNAGDVVREFTPLYGPHRQLAKGAVKDALATSRENGLLSIATEGAAENEPRYEITEFELETVRAYPAIII